MTCGARLRHITESYIQHTIWPLGGAHLTLRRSGASGGDLATAAWLSHLHCTATKSRICRHERFRLPCPVVHESNSVCVICSRCMPVFSEYGYFSFSLKIPVTFGTHLLSEYGLSDHHSLSDRLSSDERNVRLMRIPGQWLPMPGFLGELCRA